MLLLLIVSLLTSTTHATALLPLLTLPTHPPPPYYPQGWLGFTLLSELPSYLIGQYNTALDVAGYMSAIPYAAQYVMVLFSSGLFALLQMPGYGCSVGTMRQVFQCVGLLIAGCGLLMTGYMTRLAPAVSLIVVVQASQALFVNGYAGAFQEISPRFAGRLSVMANTAAAGAGAIGPIVVAALIDNYPTVYAWHIVFTISASLCGLSILMWRCFQTSKVVPELNGYSWKARGTKATTTTTITTATGFGRGQSSTAAADGHGDRAKYSRLPVSQLVYD